MRAPTGQSIGVTAIRRLTVGRASYGKSLKSSGPRCEVRRQSIAAVHSWPLLNVGRLDVGRRLRRFRFPFGRPPSRLMGPAVGPHTPSDISVTWGLPRCGVAVALGATSEQ